MTGSKTNSLTPDALKTALADMAADEDYVWDGRDEDERPASPTELRAARRGRPPKAASERKVQVSIRFSPEVLAWFRATGKGWQTRMDEALRQWIAEHGDEHGA